MPTKCIIAYIVCVSSYKIGHKQATEKGFIIDGEIAGKKVGAKFPFEKKFKTFQTKIERRICTLID